MVQLTLTNPTPAELIGCLIEALEHNGRVCEMRGNRAYRNGNTKAAIAAWTDAAHYRRQARNIRGEA